MAKILTDIREVTVSVVIPTYNRVGLLERAIRSVIRQETSAKLEILVVDDASENDTESVIESINEPRVKFARHATNRGAPAARNTGIQMATGEFIAFLDSDDEWLPHKIDSQLQKFSQPGNSELGLVTSGIVSVDELGKYEWDAPDLHGWVFEKVLSALGFPGTCSTLLIHRRVLDAGLRFDESLPAFQDYEFLLQVSRRFQIETVDEPLLFKYEDHDSPRIWNPNNVILGNQAVIDKYQDEFRERPWILAKRRMAMAVTRARSGDHNGAALEIREARKARPLDLRIVAAQVMSMVNDRLFYRGYPVLTRLDGWRGKLRRITRIVSASRSAN